MKNFINEFKEFAIKGSVIDLAVGVIIGTSLSKITTSLVNDVITPLLGIVLGKIDFSLLSIKIGSSEIKYGSFLQALIDFFLVAFIIFLCVKAINRLKRRHQATVPPPPPMPPRQEVLLTEIRDLLRENRPK